MVNKGVGRWIILLLVSFLTHTALIVNSVSSALWNEQNRTGNLLAQQMADLAMPLLLTHDMVSLSMLTSHYENHPGVVSVRFYNTNHEIIAETTSNPNTTDNNSDNNRYFSANIRLQQQALGEVSLHLYAPACSDIMRESLGNILISALLHGIIFLMGLFLARRVTKPRQGATLQPLSQPWPVPESSPRNLAANIPPPSAMTPEPPAPASLLHIALDDPSGLLTRVNAAMADEMLSLFDQFVDRVALLYGGSADIPFGLAGVSLRFTQGQIKEREFHALAAARLFLQLVTDSLQERRQYGRLCLLCKAGVLHESSDTSAVAELANMAPANYILSSQPQSVLDEYCRFDSSYHIAISPRVSLQVALLESFTPEYQQLINRQSKQILGIAKTS